MGCVERIDFSSLACDSIKSKRFDFFSNRLEKDWDWERLIFETLSARDLMVNRQGFSRFFFPRIDETAGEIYWLLVAVGRTEEGKRETRR